MKNDFQILGDKVEVYCKRNNGDIVTTTISVEDFDKVAKFEGAWFAHTDNKNFKIYIRGNADSNGKIILLHRWIAGTEDGLVTNHISGNTLDNTRENLELVTVGENNAHGKNQIEVVVRKSSTFPSGTWFEVAWNPERIEGCLIKVSPHTTKEEAWVKKPLLEARVEPARLQYVDHARKFLELGYDFSQVPFEVNEFGETVPKLLENWEIRKIKVKGVV